MTSLRDERQGWAALDFGEERELAQLRRLWESRFDRLPFDFAQGLSLSNGKALSPSKGIELEIIRVLDAGNALKASPDYELHRLTTQTPAFFDETVRRHVENLEMELGLLESEADGLAKEIEELTGEAAGIE